MFAEATVQKSGNTLHVSHGNDAGLFVEFTTEAVHQPFASTEAGRPIYKDVPHIMILFPGDKTKKIFRAAKIKREDPNDMAPTDAERFPAQWAAFQKGAEQVMVGTPPVGVAAAHEGAMRRAESGQCPHGRATRRHARHRTRLVRRA